jgi:Uma2 family endonuclease
MRATVRLTPITDDDLMQISHDNPGWQIERDATGALLLSPTSSADGARSAEVLVQLGLWARAGTGGKIFDSSTGFRLPDGSVLSPDAAWISDESLANLSPETRKKYWPIAPDVVVEVRSDSDSWRTVQAKIRTYAKNGSSYAIGIDPYARDTFAIGEPPHGLAFDLDRIFSA